MNVDHARQMDDFYRQKWQGHSGYWLDMYSEAAQMYATSLSGTRNAAIVAIVKDRVNNTLDIGCGIGDLVRLFATKSEMVFGIDIADANVQLARRNLLRDQLLNTVIVQGSAESLAFSADSFDVVIIADVIEHVRDINAALTEIARVLRPGGLLICVTPHAGIQKALVVCDFIARTPLMIGRLIVGKPMFNRQAPEVFERFLPRRLLKQALVDSELTPLSYERICFYPGPEGGGLFGRVMGMLFRRLGVHRFRRLVSWLSKGFKTMERLGWLNQKQLWIAQKIVDDRTKLAAAI